MPEWMVDRVGALDGWRKEAPQSMEQQYILGIDVGATNTKAVVMVPDGRIVDRAQHATHATSADTIFAGVFDLIAVLQQSMHAKQQEVTAIGLVSGGRYAQATGTPIFGTASLPGWIGTPVRTVIEERYGLPVWVDNDGNGAALAEWTYGAGQGSASFVCLTLGTGLGGGTVIRGHLLQGARGNASEFGHLTVDVAGRACSCGGRGCWEQYVSSTALIESTRNLLRAGSRSDRLPMLERTNGLTARTIGDAARAGDSCAGSAVAEMGYWLGVGLRNVINTIDPEIIALAGGLSALGDMLTSPARHELDRQGMIAPRLVRAELDYWAGAIGAAAGARGYAPDYMGG